MDRQLFREREPQMPTPMTFSSKDIDPLEFNSESELLPWVQTQLVAWKDLHEKASGTPAAQFTGNAVARLNELRETIARDATGSNFSKSTQAINDSLGTVWFPVKSREFQLIEYVLSKYGGKCATGFLKYLFTGRLNQNGQWWEEGEGRLFGILHREMLFKRGDFEPFRKLLDEWEQERKTAKGYFDEWMQAKAAELEHLKEQYNVIKSLHEPISYWESRQSNRHKLAWAFGVVFVAVGILGGLGLLEVVKAHAKPEILKEFPASASQTMQTIFLIRDMVPGIVIAVGLLWALRLLARLFLVQIHLQADASERVVMAQTFLSLLVGKGVAEGKEAVRPEDATLILTQLFRHESTGIFPDDSAPQVPILDLARAVQPKGGSE
jgi:Family of unknown function (DUF6161)